MSKDLDRVFNPRCVAVVGDKRANGYMWLRSLSHFSGRVYSVQVDPNELPGIKELGVQNYFSLLDVPDIIDYAVIAVPRTVATQIVRECIQKGVTGATLFTSGFSETGTEEGKQLEAVVARIAREANFNLIGPNCMGVYNPKIGLRQDLRQYWGEHGVVGFIAQSGTVAIAFSILANSQGIKVSKTVSYGNGAVLDSADFLEYLAEDAETKIIGLYVEGVRQGQRFFRTLKETAQRKPVVVWKGGEGEEGARAIASHTGSLASPQAVWDALIKQCGAIKADGLDTMIDIIKALLYLKPPRGNRVALVAMSGGESVVMTDDFTRAGLRVPQLSESSYQDFRSFFNPIGGSYANPLDISWNMPSTTHLLRILTVLSNDINIDSIVLELLLPNLALRWEYDSHFLDDLINTLAEFRLTCPKPFLIVLSPWDMEMQAKKIQVKLSERGICSFPSFQRAARALRELQRFYQSGHPSTN
jgi:acyl-CoA synthetase (NDP forming)